MWSLLWEFWRSICIYYSSGIQLFDLWLSMMSYSSFVLILFQRVAFSFILSPSKAAISSRGTNFCNLESIWNSRRILGLTWKLATLHDVLSVLVSISICTGTLLICIVIYGGSTSKTAEGEAIQPLQMLLPQWLFCFRHLCRMPYSWSNRSSWKICPSPKEEDYCCHHFFVAFPGSHEMSMPLGLHMDLLVRFCVVFFFSFYYPSLKSCKTVMTIKCH